MTPMGYSPSQGNKGGGNVQTVPMGMAPAGQPGQNVFNQSANAYTGALQGTQGVMQGGPNIGAFLNPFTEGVVNTSMDALNRARQMSMNQLGAQATQARAFGGSRHGIAEAETNRNFFDQAGQTAANLYNTGFNTALGAAQNQQNLQLQAAGQMGNLANLGFGFGTQLNDQQWRQGEAARQLQQLLIDAAKGQYAGFTGAPAASIQLPLAAVGASNMGQQTTTQTSKPGLFDYLTLGATALGGLCWVAREVYGEDDPRWVQFRTWLLVDAPVAFRRAYIRHGEAFAKVVKRLPVLKRVLRPLMNMARQRAGFEV